MQPAVAGAVSVAAASPARSASEDLVVEVRDHAEAPPQAARAARYYVRG